MYTIQKVVGNQNQEWKVLITDVEMVDENMAIITDPKDILVSDLIKEFYEVLISYKVEGSGVQHQVSLYLFLDFIKQSEDLTGNEKTIKQYMDVLFVEFNAFFLVGETVRDIRFPKLVRYKDLWDFGYRVENGFVAGVGNENDLYITDEMIDSTPKELENSLLYVVDGKITFPTIIDDNALLVNQFIRMHRRANPYIGVIDFRDFGGFEKESIQPSQVTILSSDNKETKVKIQLTQSCYDFYIGDGRDIELYKDQLDIGNSYYYKIGETKYFVDSIDTIREIGRTIYSGNDEVIVHEDFVGKLILKRSRTPFLILHGNLYRLDEYKITVDDTIEVVINHQKIVNLAEDYRNESDWLAYPANYEYNGFPVEAMNIVNYVTTEDSAILYINERNVCVKRELLEDSGFDNYYFHYRIPQGILFHKDGSIAHYQITDYDEKRALFLTNEPRVKNPIMNTLVGSENLILLPSENYEPSVLAQATIHYDYYSI